MFYIIYVLSQSTCSQGSADWNSKFQKNLKIYEKFMKNFVKGNCRALNSYQLIFIQALVLVQ